MRMCRLTSDFVIHEMQGRACPAPTWARVRYEGAGVGFAGWNQAGKELVEVLDRGE
jgi:hypothetical protein